MLASNWAELPGLERVGARDNFFEMGGHSLLATQLVSRLRDLFRMEVPLRSLFEGLTISQLAAYLIAHESKPGAVEKIAGILQAIESMSEGEMRQKLQQRNNALV